MNLTFPISIPRRGGLALLWLVMLLGEVMPGTARAALSSEPAEVFFNEVADQLLQQQLGLRLTEVQIAPTNQYR